jgi:hypothetical protein
MRLECPFCGCDAAYRPRLLALRAAAISLSLIGLLSLLLWARPDPRDRAEGRGGVNVHAAGGVP